MTPDWFKQPVIWNLQDFRIRFLPFHFNLQCRFRSGMCMIGSRCLSDPGYSSHTVIVEYRRMLNRTTGTWPA
jgi:hypothetical protein